MKFPKQKLRKKLLLTSLRGSLRVPRAIKVNKKILDFPDVSTWDVDLKIKNEKTALAAASPILEW